MVPGFVNCSSKFSVSVKNRMSPLLPTHLPPMSSSPWFGIKVILIFIEASTSPCLFHGTVVPWNVNKKRICGQINSRNAGLN